MILEDFKTPLILVSSGMIETAIQPSPEASIGMRTVFFLPILGIDFRFNNHVICGISRFYGIICGI